jgi:hypothetical protein
MQFAKNQTQLAYLHKYFQICFAQNFTKKNTIIYLYINQVN